jgi:hypothetical protein
MNASDNSTALTYLLHHMALKDATLNIVLVVLMAFRV